MIKTIHTYPVLFRYYKLFKMFDSKFHFLLIFVLWLIFAQTYYRILCPWAGCNKLIFKDHNYATLIVWVDRDNVNHPPTDVTISNKGWLQAIYVVIKLLFIVYTSCSQIALKYFSSVSWKAKHQTEIIN